MEKQYSLKEETLNAITHGLGTLLSISGLIFLVVLSFNVGTTLTLVTSIIYGVSLIMLYSSSTLYHSFKDPRITKILRTVDHCSIFLLIAGTYTPFTLITLNGSIGYILFSVIWIFAIIGIVLNIVDLKKYAKLSLICYVAMGWSIIFAIKPLVENLNRNGLILLVSGGLFYTVGIIFYKMKKTQYMHAVWHIFVLLGSVSHFVAVALYVIPKN